MRGRSPQTQITALDQWLLGHHVENLCGAGARTAQRFLWPGSLSGGTQLELFYTAGPLGKLLW